MDEALGVRPSKNAQEAEEEEFKMTRMVQQHVKEVQDRWRSSDSSYTPGHFH